MHASCSQPLIPGERFGSLKLVSLTTDDGEVCGEVPPNCTLTVDAVDDVEQCEGDGEVVLTATVAGAQECSSSSEQNPCEEKTRMANPPR